MSTPTPDKPLQSLEEYMTECHLASAATPVVPRPTGIACPTCGVELQWTSAVFFPAIPPSARADCPECGFSTVAPVNVDLPL